MFGLFKSDPTKKLEKKYTKLMEEARDVQRSGDLKLYAKMVAEAEEIQSQIAQLKSNNG